MAKKVKGKYRQQIRRLWRLYILFITLTILFFVVLSLNFLGRLPSLKELENPHYFEATEIYSSDGIILGNFFFENRVNIIY
ncbi:MAG: penicillin-binding protein, partial [Bacteroidota bacterium]